MDVKPYREFCGTYQHEDDELTISHHDNKLFLSFPYTKEMLLHRETDDLFFVQEVSDSVRLNRLGDNTYQVSIININNKEAVYRKVISFQI